MAKKSYSQVSRCNLVQQLLALSSTMFFYHALFEKYTDYASLPVYWWREKDEMTDRLAVRIPDGSRVLSVG